MNAHGFRVAAWVGLVVLVCATAYLGFLARWVDAFMLSLFLIAALAFLLARERLPTLFGFLFVVASILNGMGWVFDFWSRIPLYDPITHAFTTFAVTLAGGFVAYYSVRVHFCTHVWIFALAIGSFGLAVGALWEILEWSLAIPQTYRGVAVDLIMDTLGALIAALFAARVIARQPASSDPKRKDAGAASG